MNRNEVHGGVRYYGGKIEKGVGDAIDSRDWQVEGVVDQVAGGAEHLYGRAKSIAGDAIDAAPGLAGEAKDALGEAAGRIGDAARDGRDSADDAVRQNPTILLIAAAIGGYALSWLIHGRRG